MTHRRTQASKRTERSTDKQHRQCSSKTDRQPQRLPRAFPQSVIVLMELSVRELKYARQHHSRVITNHKTLNNEVTAYFADGSRSSDSSGRCLTDTSHMIASNLCNGNRNIESRQYTLKCIKQTQTAMKAEIQTNNVHYEMQINSSTKSNRPY